MVCLTWHKCGVYADSYNKMGSMYFFMIIFNNYWINQVQPLQYFSLLIYANYFLSAKYSPCTKNPESI